MMRQNECEKKKKPARFNGDKVTKRVTGSGSEFPSPAWSSGSGSSFLSGLTPSPLLIFPFLVARGDPVWSAGYEG